MRRKIRRSIHIVVTESWTVVWEDEDASLPAGDGSHVITWEDGEQPPAAIVLRRQADGSGWRVETRDFWDTADTKRKSFPREGD